MTHMFLNGGGMRGGSLHHLLGGAPLIAEISTAPLYRLHSVGDRYPALEPAPSGAGAAIAGEVYDLPLDVLRDQLLPAEPPELELGVIELADGTASLGMVLRRSRPPLDDLHDITRYGGWRSYLSRELGHERVVGRAGLHVCPACRAHAAGRAGRVPEQPDAFPAVPPAVLAGERGSVVDERIVSAAAARAVGTARGTGPGGFRFRGPEQPGAFLAPQPVMLAGGGRHVDREPVLGAEVRTVRASRRADPADAAFRTGPEQAAAPRAPPPLGLEDPVKKTDDGAGELFRPLIIEQVPGDAGGRVGIAVAVHELILANPPVPPPERRVIGLAPVQAVVAEREQLAAIPVVAPIPHIGLRGHSRCHD